MKRVLIVSPNFPPTNKPDHQRVRMALPYLEEYGWKADVLCLEPKRNEVVDHGLLKTIPDSTNIHRILYEPKSLLRSLGINSLYWNFSEAFEEFGNRLLQKKKYDLVFFSTTQFPFFRLGLKWKKKYSVPFVCDYQDPWITDYYFRTGSPDPPGGWLRYYPNYLCANWMEKKVIRECSGIVSVSSFYSRQLKERYPNLQIKKAVIPFGASSLDQEIAEKTKLPISLDQDQFNLFYIGRCSESFAPSLNYLFSIVSMINDDNLKLNFIGTSYDGPESYVSRLAAHSDISKKVHEQSERLSYHQSLKLMMVGDVTLVLGTDDRAYLPSKLFSCLMAAKKVLIICHSKSELYRVANKLNLVNIICYDRNSLDEGIEILKNMYAKEKMELDVKLKEHINAKTMTKKLCHFFDGTIL